MILSICIATYKRPELLGKLINSLYDQNIKDDWFLEIIVVDNDAEQTAKDLCAEYKDTDRIKLSYFVQPEKNISTTRNKAVEHATGAYIFFIDDDETVVRDWIEHHLNTINNFNADVVIGRVVPEFESEVPDWVKNSYLFSWETPQTGTPAIKTYTGNCVIRASLLKSLKGPFDPAYGITGGEDTHLFRRLRAKGAKFVNCYEALATENIPTDATKLSWMISRTFRQGYLFTYHGMKLGKKQTLLNRTLQIIKSFVYSVISFLLVIITFFNKTLRVYWLTKIASNFGHLVAAGGYRLKAFRQ